MFLKRLIIGCAVLSILPHVARCQSDASLEKNASDLSHLSGPGYDSLPGQTSQEAVGHVKPMLNTKGKSSKDYQNFGNDEHRSTRDVDSIESNSNVNVNVNSRSPSTLPWNQPQMYRIYRPPSSQYGRYHRKTTNRSIPSIRLSPHSNIDYNFGHPDGNMRLQRRRLFRGKTSMNNQRAAKSEDNDNLVPSGDITLCYPTILQVVKYLQRIETNLMDIEKELSTFLLGPEKNTSGDNL